MAEPRRKRLVFVLLGAVVIALLIWAFLVSRKPAVKAKTSSVPVSVAKVEVQDIPVAVTAIGSALAWQGVLIRAQVSGVLERVAVREGSDVAAGDLLAEINPAPYRAALLQAQGALKRDTALLQAARVDLVRYQTLLAQDSIARQQRDTQAALVQQDEGTVLIDKGSVAAAQVNLDFCRITSPVSGRVGVRLVDPGNLVSASDTTGIVSVNQITPIAVTFTIPEGDFQRLADVSQGFTKPLTTEALSQETGASLGYGALSIADNHVDSSSGTVTMKARFPNAAKHLWPGQFVNVRLTLQTLAHATTVPAEAVNQGPNGAFVYIVGPDNKVSVRPTTVALTQGSIAVIKSGPRPGETVVVDGQMVLKAGLTVVAHTVNAARKPAA